MARKRGDVHAALLISAGLLSTPWLGMFGALLIPGTSMRDPGFDVPLGLRPWHAPALLTAAGALLVLGTAVVLANRSRGEVTAAA